MDGHAKMYANKVGMMHERKVVKLGWLITLVWSVSVVM